MDALDFELENTQYWPDAHLPVDRWYQAANASNARTTSSILDLLHGGEGDVVLDPFAGGGSSAIAARLQKRPFYGIEHDPLLATVSLAKAESRPEHVQFLPDTNGAGNRAWLPEALAAIHARSDPDEALVVSALAVVVALGAALGTPLDAATLRADLVAMPTHAPPGRIVCGDSTSLETWKLLRLPRTGVLAYTSPPFGPTSPTLSAPRTIRDQASRLLAGHGRLSSSSRGRADPEYADITMAMLHCLVRHAVRGQIVLEHEPDDNESDSTDAVLDRIATELRGVLHAPRRNRYDAFSKRGRFTLLTHRIRSHRVDGSTTDESSETMTMSNARPAPEILVTGSHPIPPAALELLRSHNLRARIRPGRLGPDELHRALDGVVGYLIGGDEGATAEHFERAAALKVAAWIGTDFRGNVPGWRRAIDRGIAFVSTPGANAVSVAEFTIRLMLTLARPIPASSAEDDPPLIGTELRGRTIGLVGAGRIGAHVARMATLGLGMRAVYAAPRRNEPLEAALDISHVELSELLARSDVVSLHRPGPGSGEQPELGSEQLAQLREGALLLNTGHHGLVDPVALRRVIEERGIRAAFDGIGSGDPWERLTQFDRTRFLAPQQMGYLTDEAFATAAIRATEGLCAVLAGPDSPLPGNPGYRVQRDRRSPR